MPSLHPAGSALRHSPQAAAGHDYSGAMQGVQCRRGSRIHNEVHRGDPETQTMRPPSLHTQCAASTRALGPRFTFPGLQSLQPELT